MQKAAKLILCVSIVANIMLGLLFLRPSKHVEPITKEYLEKIDSLERDIDSLQKDRDSIRFEIDTVYADLDKNNKAYEKTRNDVLSYSVDDDCRFFASYLNWNSQRLDSINNSNSAEGN